MGNEGRDSGSELAADLKIGTIGIWTLFGRDFMENRYIFQDKQTTQATNFFDKAGSMF